LLPTYVRIACHFRHDNGGFVCALEDQSEIEGNMLRGQADATADEGVNDRLAKSVQEHMSLDVVEFGG
jgi:hypothetical protein